MTISTTILDPQTVITRLQKLVTTITLQIAKLTALIPLIAARTAVQPVGVIGWIKQARYVLAQIQTIERILSLIATIIAEITALPFEALATIVNSVEVAIQNVENQIISQIRAQINDALGDLVSPSDISQVEQVQAQLSLAQQTLQGYQSLYAQLQGQNVGTTITSNINSLGGISIKA